MTQVVDTLLRPTLTVYDPEETGEPYYAVHFKNGVLSQPNIL